MLDPPGVRFPLNATKVGFIFDGYTWATQQSVSALAVIFLSSVLCLFTYT